VAARNNWVRASKGSPCPVCKRGDWCCVSADGALARWAWDHLVNRRDVWGAYWPLELRADRGNSWTAPARTKRGQVFLTLGTLELHFAGRDVSHVVGLHSTSPANTSRWGGVDVDAHEGGRADPRANQAAALAWYARLRGLGFAPLLTDSNGAGGFHLLALFAEPVPRATCATSSAALASTGRTPSAAGSRHRRPGGPPADNTTR
jgi:hypothetical protein